MNLINHSLELKKIIFWIAFSWMLLITILCLMKQDDFPTVSIPYFDKIVHFSFYFISTCLWFLFFKTRRRKMSRKARKRYQIVKPLTKAFSISLFYGMLVEISQEYLTTDRQADIKDILANFAGATLASILIYVAFSIYKKRLLTQ